MTINRTPELPQGRTPAKRFAGHRSYEQIRAECRRQGLVLEDANYRRNGSDWIGVRRRRDSTVVLYSTPTGRFHGTHPTCGTQFTESSPFDGEPWFDALLAFFYYEDGPATSRPMSMVDATLGGVRNA